MATITWTNGNATGLWNDAGNWDAGVPTGADDAVLDATSTAACTCNVAIDVLSLTVAAAYSGKFDFADSAFSHLIGTGGALFVGSGEVDCGDSTVTYSGDWDYVSQGTWTRATSTMIMTGDGSVIAGNSNNFLHNMTFSANVTVSGGNGMQAFGATIVDSGKTLTLGQTYISRGLVTVNGVISINSGVVLNMIGTLAILGEVSGLGSVLMNTGSITDASGTVSPGSMTLRRTLSIAPGTYDTSILADSGQATNQTITINAGIFVFTGSLTADADAAGDLTIKMDTTNPTVTFEDDLRLNETGGGALIWLKGSGLTTFGGTSVYDDSTAAGADLGDVAVGDGDALGLASDMKTDDLTIEQNAVITGAFLFDVGGNFLVNGASGNTVTWTDADLSVSGTAVASFTTVTNSDASIAGGTEIDATNNCTDSGGNTNWDFGAAVGNPWYHYANQAAIVG